jgi:hypothetical protein
VHLLECLHQRNEDLSDDPFLRHRPPPPLEGFEEVPPARVLLDEVDAALVFEVPQPLDDVRVPAIEDTWSATVASRGTWGKGVCASSQARQVEFVSELGDSANKKGF